MMSNDVEWPCEVYPIIDIHITSTWFNKFHTYALGIHYQVPGFCFVLRVWLPHRLHLCERWLLCEPLTDLSLWFGAGTANDIAAIPISAKYLTSLPCLVSSHDSDLFQGAHCSSEMDSEEFKHLHPWGMCMPCGTTTSCWTHKWLRRQAGKQHGTQLADTNLDLGS